MSPGCCGSVYSVGNKAAARKKDSMLLNTIRSHIATAIVWQQTLTIGMSGVITAILRFILAASKLNILWLLIKFKIAFSVSFHILSCVSFHFIFKSELPRNWSFFLNRKKLLETIEFIKKCVSMPHIPQQLKTPTNQCQKEVIVDIKDKEKHKVLNNLPKVGVCKSQSSLSSHISFVINF